MKLLATNKWDDTVTYRWNINLRNQIFGIKRICLYSLQAFSARNFQWNNGVLNFNITNVFYQVMLKITRMNYISLFNESCDLWIKIIWSEIYYLLKENCRIVRVYLRIMYQGRTYCVKGLFNGFICKLVMNFWVYSLQNKL